MLEFTEDEVKDLYDALGGAMFLAREAAKKAEMDEDFGGYVDQGFRYAQLRKKIRQFREVRVSEVSGR